MPPGCQRPQGPGPATQKPIGQPKTNRKLALTDQCQAFRRQPNQTRSIRVQTAKMNQSNVYRIFKYIFEY